jgi:hypothetical protein
MAEFYNSPAERAGVPVKNRIRTVDISRPCGPIANKPRPPLLPVAGDYRRIELPVWMLGRFNECQADLYPMIANGKTGIASQITSYHTQYLHVFVNITRTVNWQETSGNGAQQLIEFRNNLLVLHSTMRSP